MNIAINTLPLSTEHRMRGTGVYTKNLIDALLKYEKNNTYTFFTRPQDISKDTDLVHFPFFDPFFLTLPFFKQYPTIVTVHDLIPLMFPEKFPPGIRGRLKWQIQRLSLIGAASIITDSKRSKTDIVCLIGKPDSSVHVVPLAASLRYRHKPKADVQKVKTRYHLPDDYILYVGEVNWNKNVSGLLRAWKIVRNKLSKSSYKLVLAGSSFTDTSLRETRDLLREIESLGIGKSVVRPGFIKEGDMAALYSGATASILPSWYEGFGFPVLEAMACHTPVIATTGGSVPEIAGPAIRIDPGSVNNIASAVLETICLPKAARAALVAKEIQWVRQFTWERVAKKTVAVYENIIHHHSDI